MIDINAFPYVDDITRRRAIPVAYFSPALGNDPDEFPVYLRLPEADDPWRIVSGVDEFTSATHPKGIYIVEHGRTGEHFMPPDGLVYVSAEHFMRLDQDALASALEHAAKQLVERTNLIGDLTPDELGERLTTLGQMAAGWLRLLG